MAGLEGVAGQVLALEGVHRSAAYPVVPVVNLCANGKYGQLVGGLAVDLFLEVGDFHVDVQLQAPELIVDPRDVAALGRLFQVFRRYEVAGVAAVGVFHLEVGQQAEVARLGQQAVGAHAEERCSEDEHLVLYDIAVRDELADEVHRGIGGRERHVGNLNVDRRVVVEVVDADGQVQVVDRRSAQGVERAFSELIISIVVGDVQLFGQRAGVLAREALQLVGVRNAGVGEEVVDAPFREERLDYIVFRHLFGWIALGIAGYDDVLVVDLQVLELHGHHELRVERVPLYVSGAREAFFGRAFDVVAEGELVFAYGHGLALELVGLERRGRGVGDVDLVGAVEQRGIDVLCDGEVLHVEVVASVFYRFLVEADRLYSQHEVVAFLDVVLQLLPLDFVAVCGDALLVEGRALERLLHVGVGLAVKELHFILEFQRLRFHTFASDVPYVAPFHLEVVVDENLAGGALVERWRRYGGITELVERVGAQTVLGRGTPPQHHIVFVLTVGVLLVGRGQLVGREVGYAEQLDLALAAVREGHEVERALSVVGFGHDLRHVSGFAVHPLEVGRGDIALRNRQARFLIDDGPVVHGFHRRLSGHDLLHGEGVVDVGRCQAAVVVRDSPDEPWHLRRDVGHRERLHVVAEVAAEGRRYAYDGVCEAGRFGQITDAEGAMSVERVAQGIGRRQRRVPFVGHQASFIGALGQQTVLGLAGDGDVGHRKMVEHRLHLHHIQHFRLARSYRERLVGLAGRRRDHAEVGRGRHLIQLHAHEHVLCLVCIVLEREREVATGVVKISSQVRGQDVLHRHHGDRDGLLRQRHQTADESYDEKKMISK